MNGTLYRYTAFTSNPEGGNPAGVWIGESLPDPAEMQRIAADVGFSETAFVAPASGHARTIRYYSPEAEVTFCGHATIATGVVLGEHDGPGRYELSTTVGVVPVDVTANGVTEATLESVEPRHEAATADLLDDVLGALGWSADELDPSIPPARAYAGAWHLVVAAASAERLADLEYDFDLTKEAMLRNGLTTLQLIWRENETLFHSRNPFPVGGVIEDPATGAAAAALGGYLRDAGLVDAPTALEIRQGETMGRPSKLRVTIPETGGILVTGQAVPLTET